MIKGGGWRVAVMTLWRMLDRKILWDPPWWVLHFSCFEIQTQILCGEFCTVYSTSFTKEVECTRANSVCLCVCRSVITFLLPDILLLRRGTKKPRYFTRFTSRLILLCSSSPPLTKYFPFPNIFLLFRSSSSPLTKYFPSPWQGVEFDQVYKSILNSKCKCKYPVNLHGEFSNSIWYVTSTEYVLQIDDSHQEAKIFNPTESPDPLHCHQARQEGIDKK